MSLLPSTVIITLVLELKNTLLVLVAVVEFVTVAGELDSYTEQSSVI